MTNITVTNLAKDMNKTTAVYTKPASAGRTEDFELDLKGTKDVLVILDASACASALFTANFCEGDGIGAKSTTVSVEAGETVVIKIASGEIIRENGKAKLNLVSSVNLSSSAFKIAAINQRAVEIF